MESVLSLLPAKLRGAVRTLLAQESIPAFLLELSNTRAAWISEAKACRECRENPPVAEIAALEQQIAMLQTRLDAIKDRMESDAQELAALARAEEMNDRIKLFAKAAKEIRKIREASKAIDQYEKTMRRLGLNTNAN